MRIAPKGADHWRTGKVTSNETKLKLSAKKLGDKHPKFKGYYITPAGEYPSANQAAKALNMHTSQVVRWSKKGINGYGFRAA